jgi:hypothetical protein
MAKKYAVQVFCSCNKETYQKTTSVDPTIVLYNSLEEASAAACCFRSAKAIEYIDAE